MVEGQCWKLTRSFRKRREKKGFYHRIFGYAHDIDTLEKRKDD